MPIYLRTVDLPTMGVCVGRSVRRRAMLEGAALGAVVVVSVLLVGGSGVHAPPIAPREVRDGSRPGADSDRTEWSAAYAANWSTSIDETGRPVRYELCLRERDERCDDERWFSAGRDGVTSGTLSMVPGTWLLSCVRARDVAGDFSEERCSDGFRVTAAAEEVEQVIERRAEAGLPADRATVERQLADGAYGESWYDLEAPVEPGEERDYTWLEFQTWTLDHGRQVEYLYQRGIRLEVPSASHVLHVTAPARSCSAAAELGAAFGSRLVDGAPTPVRVPTYRSPVDPPLDAKPTGTSTSFPSPTDAQVRSLVQRHVLSDPGYRAIAIESVTYERAGVPAGCLHAMAEWLERRDTRRYLASHGFRYVGAIVDVADVRILAEGDVELPGSSDLLVIRRPVGGTTLAT